MINFQHHGTLERFKVRKKLISIITLFHVDMSYSQLQESHLICKLFYLFSKHQHFSKAAVRLLLHEIC